MARSVVAILLLALFYALVSGECAYEGDHPLKSCLACSEWCSSGKPVCACNTTSCDGVVLDTLPVTTETRCMDWHEDHPVACYCGGDGMSRFMGRDGNLCAISTADAEMCIAACGGGGGCAVPLPTPSPTAAPTPQPSTSPTAEPTTQSPTAQPTTAEPTFLI